jgi:ABC-type multidrug transport system fused ATPase/permease subunit
VLQRLLTFQSPRLAWLLLALMVFNAGCEVLSVAAVYPFGALASDPTLLERNVWLQRLHHGLGNAPLTTFVIQLGGVFLATFLLTTASNALTLWMQHRYTLNLRHALSTHLLRSYLARDYSWLLNQHTAELCKNVLAETDRLIHEVVAKLTTMANRGLSALSICLVLVVIQPWVALTTSLSLLISYRYIYRFFRTRLDSMGKRRLEENQRRHQLVQESLSALKEGRVGHRRHLLHQEFETSSLAYARLDLGQRLIGEFPRFLTETLAIVAIVGVFCYLVSLGKDPRQAFPWIGLYIMATWRLVPNLQELYSCLVDVRLNWPILEKLDPEWAQLQPIEAARPLPMKTMLALEEVDYRYPGAERPALSGVSLQIPLHSLVALVGKTGSGKTTAADLLAGYLTPQRGRVSVDGEPIDRERWQANVGYVPQTIYLLSDTVARNIALGVPEESLDREALGRATEVAHLNPLLEKLPQGLSTLLGERGLTLSGGERQRIGIARALYHQPEVLIFDEATSALDRQTESAVMGAIESLAHRHTVVLIAHRLSTVQSCDCIFVFEEGRLVSQGSFAQLSATCPVFQALSGETVEPGSPELESA